MRTLTILLAFGLIAAACGSGETSAPFQSPETTAAATLPPSSDEAPTTTTSEAPATSLPAEGATTTASPAAPTELPDSDYPDVIVSDLAGGDINLRELVLEAQPVLLWFWAPH